MNRARKVARAGAMRVAQEFGLHVQRRKHRNPLVEGLVGLLSQPHQSSSNRVAALCMLRGAQAMLTVGVAPGGQLLQDVMALGVSGPRRHFVEFGAGHPWNLSNTRVLATHFGWHGTRAEPNPDFFRLHDQERLPGVSTAMVFVGAQDGEVSFLPLGELGTRVDLSQTDGHKGQRRRLSRSLDAISVRSQSPKSFMTSADVPRSFAFLSVDTEGSELEIMKAFPFEEFSFDFACIEHNFDQERRISLTALMNAKGYSSVLREYSAWDSWFINEGRIAEIGADFGVVHKG